GLDRLRDTRGHFQLEFLRGPLRVSLGPAISVVLEIGELRRWPERFGLRRGGRGGSRETCEGLLPPELRRLAQSFAFGDYFLDALSGMRALALIAGCGRTRIITLNRRSLWLRSRGNRSSSRVSAICRRGRLRLGGSLRSVRSAGSDWIWHIREFG